MSKLYGELIREGDSWVIPRLEPQAIIKLKQLFPRIPRAAGPPFSFRADPGHDVDLEWFLQRYPLDATTADLRALREGRDAFHALQSQAEALLGESYVPPPWVGLKPGQTVRPHQSATAELLGVVKGLLVGDDVGEGKTFSCMAACLLPGALPATIVVDPHLQGQWADRFASFTNLTTHQVDSTIPYALPPVAVRIFRWTQLLGWADMFDSLGSGLVGFDEMQELRTGTDSGRGMAAQRLVANAHYRLGMTATPIYGYGVEIWNVMRYLRPEVLGDRGDFLREWAPHGSVKDPKALGAYLREQHAMVRKRKAADRVNKIVQQVEHDADAMASIEDIAHQLAVTATSGRWSERGEAARQLDLRVRQQTGIAKAAAVAAVVRILVEAGTPVLLAGWHREVYATWLEKLSDLKPAMYTGSETPAKKKAEMARFLSGDTDVFIISLRSGRGVDGLQARCRVVVFGELDWSGKVHDQVIGRLDREGSILDGTDEEITALFLVADDGSDPPMMELIGVKNFQSSGIVDPDIALQSSKSDESHLKALIGRYLEKRGAP